MAIQKLGEEFEDVELGSIEPAIVIQPLTDQLSQDGDQNGIVRRIVTEEEAAEHTAYAYRSSLKWKILVVLWMVSLVKTSRQSNEPRRRLCTISNFDSATSTNYHKFSSSLFHFLIVIQIPYG